MRLRTTILPAYSRCKVVASPSGHDAPVARGLDARQPIAPRRGRGAERCLDTRGRSGESHRGEHREAQSRGAVTTAPAAWSFMRCPALQVSPDDTPRRVRGDSSIPDGPTRTSKWPGISVGGRSATRGTSLATTRLNPKSVVSPGTPAIPPAAGSWPNRKDSTCSAPRGLAGVSRTARMSSAGSSIAPLKVTNGPLRARLFTHAIEAVVVLRAMVPDSGSATPVSRSPAS